MYIKHVQVRSICGAAVAV